MLEVNQFDSCKSDLIIFSIFNNKLFLYSLFKVTTAFKIDNCTVYHLCAP